jgi:hypothetical protein
MYMKAAERAIVRVAGDPEAHRGDVLWPAGRAYGCS